jgi:hypothetical protein
MHGTVDHLVKQNKPDWEIQILYVLSHMQNLVLNNEWQELKTVLFEGRYQPAGGVGKKGEDERGSEYDSSILYTCMKTE